MLTFRLPPVMVTLTNRRVYWRRLYARPLGFLLFSWGSTFGVWDLTLPVVTHTHVSGPIQRNSRDRLLLLRKMVCTDQRGQDCRELFPWWMMILLSGTGFAMAEFDGSCGVGRFQLNFTLVDCALGGLILARSAHFFWWGRKGINISPARYLPSISCPESSGDNLSRSR